MTEERAGPQFVVYENYETKDEVAIDCYSEEHLRAVMAQLEASGKPYKVFVRWQ